MNPNSQSKFFIASILAVSCLLVIGTALLVLYDRHVDSIREQLCVTVRSQARLIESVARFDSASTAAQSLPGHVDFVDLTLSQIIDAHRHYRGFGKTGEFAIAKLSDDTIRFQFRHRHDDMESPLLIPMKSGLAEPMQRALTGESGAMRGLDYRGVEVLAAYEPIAVLKMGVVAKIDMSEVRSPFMVAAAVSGAVAVVIIFLGMIFVIKAVQPLLKRLKKYSRSLETQIEARKATEEELNRYKDIVSFSLDLVAIVDTNLVYKIANAKYLAAIGKTRDQVIGKTIPEVMGEDFYNDIIKSGFERSLNGETTQHEDSIDHPELGKRYYDVHYYPCLDQSGNIRGIAVNRRDITKRKEDEEKLNYQARLIDSVSDAVISVDTDGCIQSWNNAAEQVYGWTADQAIGNHIEAFLEIDYQKYPRDKFFTVLRQDGCWEGEIRQKCKDGSWITVYASVAVVTDNLGVETGLVGVYRDITEIKTAEEARRNSEEQFRLICSAARDPIVMINESGLVETWNDAAADLFGYTKQEAVGQPIHMLIAPEYLHADIAKRLRTFQLTGNGRAIGRTLELSAIHKDGRTIPIELSLSRAKRGGKWHAIGVLRDITERKTAEAEREKLEKQLRHSQKLETVGTLAGGIAHDFNNILVPILMTSQMMLDEADHSSKTYNDAWQINIAAKRAKDLVKHILTFSRQQENAKIDTDLIPIVKEVLKFFESSLPSTIDLVYNIDLQSFRVKADPTQIHQVLMNLCTNAYQAIGEQNGRIAIELRRETLASGFSPAGEIPEGDFAVLRVEDSGGGIDPEVKEHIFEPFFTTKEVGKGTGLGLSVAHGIIKDHDGFFHVDSKPGFGTTFAVYLPLIENRCPDGNKKESRPKGGNEHILLIDDDRDTADTFEETLTHFGYKVTVFNDSTECIEALRRNSNGYHLILTDQIMPKITGDQMIEQIKKIELDVPAIVMTGYSSKISESNYRDYGFEGFLMKPVIPQELDKEIRRVLDKRAESNRTASSDT